MRGIGILGNLGKLEELGILGNLGILGSSIGDIVFVPNGATLCTIGQFTRYYLFGYLGIGVIVPDVERV